MTDQRSALQQAAAGGAQSEAVRSHQERWARKVKGQGDDRERRGLKRYPWWFAK